MSAAVNFPATVSASIPIAGFKEVYDVATVDKALQQLTSSASDALKSTYEKMLRLGGAHLAEFSPREMRRVMFNAFGNAKLAGHDEVEEADIAESRGKQKQRIGF